MDPANGAAFDSSSWQVPYPLGLIWDGSFFWNVSSAIRHGGDQRVYKVGAHVSNLGDVNNDGNCNSTDALIILSYDVGLSVPQEFRDRINAGFGDVNADKVTNSTDALILLSFDARFPVPFPVCQPALQ
jgi:hypothetical protein